MSNAPYGKHEKRKTGFVKRSVGKTLNKIIKLRNGLIYYMSYPHDLKILKKIRGICTKNNLDVWEIEAYVYANFLKSTIHLEGDVAEVGVYTGRSAKVIEGFRGNKKLYLFDTFEGMPDTVKEIDEMYWKGKYDNANFDGVKELFSGDENVFIHKGLFPQETGKHIESDLFSFVHLDVNIYQSNLDCLKFFYPRMVENGVILIHNTSQAEGTRRALEEFNKLTNTVSFRLPCNLSMMIKKRSQSVIKSDED